VIRRLVICGYGSCYKNMSLESLGLGFRPSAAMENLSVMLLNPAKNSFFI
jgi:hypothetical protein